MTTWSFSLDLGILYPGRAILNQLQARAWQYGLHFDGNSSRGLLGSQVNIHVSGEASAVGAYAKLVEGNYG